MDTENINLTVCKLKQCLLLLKVQRISIIEKSQALENGRLSVFVIEIVCCVIRIVLRKIYLFYDVPQNLPPIFFKIVMH